MFVSFSNGFLIVTKDVFKVKTTLTRAGLVFQTLDIYT